MAHLPFDPDETILREVRKHWLVLVAPAAGALFMIVLPLVVYAAGSIYVPDIVEVVQNYTSVLVFAYALWSLLWWMFFFVRWTDYYLDVWYVTDVKIIDIEQKGFFNREISALRYEKIQDITVETVGLVATLLNFGDIHVQTAGESRKIIIEHATNPEKVKRIITDHMAIVAERYDHDDPVRPHHGKEGESRSR